MSGSNMSGQGVSGASQAMSGVGSAGGGNKINSFVNQNSDAFSGSRMALGNSNSY